MKQSILNRALSALTLRELWTVLRDSTERIDSIRLATNGFTPETAELADQVIQRTLKQGGSVQLIVEEPAQVLRSVLRMTHIGSLALADVPPLPKETHEWYQFAELHALLPSLPELRRLSEGYAVAQLATSLVVRRAQTHGAHAYIVAAIPDVKLQVVAEQQQVTLLVPKPFGDTTEGRALGFPLDSPAAHLAHGDVRPEDFVASRGRYCPGGHLMDLSPSSLRSWALAGPFASVLEKNQHHAKRYASEIIAAVAQFRLGNLLEF